MHVKIFTLPFDGVLEGFPDELVADFCRNKKVIRMETHFFRQAGKAYWSVAVHYELLPSGDRATPRELDEGQQLLYQRLKEWRKEAAAKEGLPAYLLATNAQLIQIVKLKCVSLESFKAVKGFGKQRVQKYGKRINELIKAFFESEQPPVLGVGPGEEADTSDVPF